MGFFDDIAMAEVGAGGVYFLQGVYLVEVVRVKMFKSRKKEDLFIIELKILESNCEQRPVGTKASHVINMKHDAALGNVKMFVAAVNGVNPDDRVAVNEEVTPEVCELVVSDENPLQGLRVNLECTNITTRDGNPFTLHRYSPIEAA